MKRLNKLYLMLGILAVVSIAAFAVTRLEEERENIQESGEIVLEVPADTVQALSWSYGNTSLSFHRDETWLYDEDEAFPVNDETVQKMLELFEGFGVSFIIEDVTDYGMYGLDEPECTIQFETADQSYTVELGEFSSMDGERYVSIGDGNVYLAKTDPLDTFDVELKDMIRHDETLSYKQVTQIQFEGELNDTIFYDAENPAACFEDDVYFTQRNGETEPLSTDRVETWLESLTTLRLNDYVTYHVTEEELETFNLKDPELTVTVEYTPRDADDGETAVYTLSISRDPEELAAAEEAEANGEDPEDVTAYVRVGSSQIIYRVSESSSNSLRAASFHELCHREVLMAAFEDVIQLDVTLEDTTYTLLTDGEDEDGERIWTYQEDEIEIEDLQYALETLTVEYSGDFTSDQPAGKEEIRLTAWLDSGASLSVELYRQNGEDCLAVVDGAPLAMVSRSDVVELIEAVNAIVLN